jgi:hypothetical protein
MPTHIDSIPAQQAGSQISGLIGLAQTSAIPVVRSRNALLFSMALTACAASAHATEVIERAVNPKFSKASARTSAWNDLKKLVRFAQQPAKASIMELSRQFGFNYTVGECHPVESSEDWCEYQARYPRKPVTRLAMIGFGTNQRTRQPMARMSLQILDPRVCFTPAEMETVLGPGELYATPVPLLMPGQSLPPFVRVFDYSAIPRGGVLGVNVEYAGRCAKHVNININL